jgi:MscS family membrane protein
MSEFFSEGFFAKTFYGNTITEWLIAFGIVILSVILGKIFHRFFKSAMRRATAKSKTKLDDLIVDMVEEPFVFTVIVVGFYAAIQYLNLTPDVRAFFGKVFYVLTSLTVAWLIVRLVDSIIKEFLAPLVAKSESDLDDQLLPILRKGVKSAIWIIAFIVAANNAGYDVGALIAGLGIGGLAFALAAQDTVGNLFGGVTIFLDKPFTVNDRVQIAGFDGVVKEIGLRSVRLQTLAGRMVTIPNRTFTDSPVENVSSEPNRKVALALGLTYDTKPEQIEQAMQHLRDINAKSDNTEENMLISFDAFGDFALGITFIYYIKKGADIMETQTEINLAILKTFNENGLEFAFPTQTIITQQG